jgi:delta(3,5)-delta(2,4)-dienoyl-CoA isomerase
MWLEFGQIFSKLSHDSDVRAIVLSGAGDKAFTAGLDVNAASQSTLANDPTEKIDVARKAVALRRHVDEFQRCVGSVEECEKRKSTSLSESFIRH